MSLKEKQSFKLRHSYFLFLLPIFFVLHGYAENFGFVSLKDVLILAASYCLMSILICIFSYFFFRDWIRAALITTFWMAFFFFFAAFHEFLKENSPVKFFSRYSFLLPTSLALLVLLFIYLKKTPKRFSRFAIFLNILLIVYILLDLINISWKVLKPSDHKLSVYDFARSEEIIVCDTCYKPDIYFLVFDEYASSASLKSKYNYHNNIDSFLVEKGFSVQAGSKSNYNFTIFSLASILNMSYVEGIKNTNAVTVEDYGNCEILIRNNKVIHFLDAQGYEIINYSIFNLAGHPTRVTQSFLPLQTKLITDRTLFARLNKDLGWILHIKFPFTLFTKNNFFRHLNNDNLLIAEVKKAVAKKQKKPRFIYAHLNMPHIPYYYDKNLKLKEIHTLIGEYNTNPPQAYLDYLNYTNHQLKGLVTTIQTNDSSAVIVLMSDHGFRRENEPEPYHLFANLNSVYFPNKNYRLLYDSISGVNQYRVVFNTLFHQSFPLLKDTSILLLDKK